MNTKVTITLRVMSILMLGWALNPANPYGYYVVLRWILCPACAFLAVHAHDARKTGWVWLFGVTAAIYNPVFRVHLDRQIWLFVNIATIVMFAVSFIASTRGRRTADD